MFRMCRRQLLFGSGVLANATAPEPGLDAFLDAARDDAGAAGAALRTLAAGWRPGFACMLVDVLRLPLPDGHPTRRRLVAFLEERTGQSFGHDVRQWQQWMRALPYEPHPRYAEYKGLLYSSIDPRMGAFFPPGVHARLRLDHVDWGGVQVNGIPPLVNPPAVDAAEAGYLKDDHVVFGIAWNGEARAYPKRILAWHELARDRIGGLELALVYCTLCGTVIPYHAEAGGRRFTFGTSGLLYESSKLMFDEETMSLWPALEGRPAIGTLTGSGLQLGYAPVVTTRWGEWRRQHPRTTVLALETGHRRDYGEGVAYRDYFATDRLMFPVSRTDRRLRNKDEVLVVRREGRPAVAFAVRRLMTERVLVHGGLVVVTTSKGANRVYQAGENAFAAAVDDVRVRDRDGQVWEVTETALAREDRRLPRVPAHRAFWFGWYAQFPDTELVK